MEAARTARPPPRTWLLLGEKPGDNAQARMLAGALGWPVEVRTLRMQERWRFGKPRVRASLAHLDLAGSDALEPPWPELVIAVGRRLSSVALWIRQASAGRARLVLIGKPRRLADRFDLIVASAQYRVGARDNLVRIELPLVRVDPAAVAAAAEAWRERLAPLPRPLTALLVGGPTKPVRFDAAVARQLARASARAGGGTLYVCTSRRTPHAVADALAAALPPGGRLYRWQPDDPANPYLALLGLADRFVVTSDSVTMGVEVARLGRPLAVFRLPERRRLWRALTRSRDLDAVARLLIAQRRAVPLGEPFLPPQGPPPDEVQLVAARVRALFEPAPTSPPG